MFFVMIYVYTLLPLVYAIFQRRCCRNFIYGCQMCSSVAFRGVCGLWGVTITHQHVSGGADESYLRRRISPRASCRGAVFQLLPRAQSSSARDGSGLQTCDDRDGGRGRHIGRRVRATATALRSRPSRLSAVRIPRSRIR